MNKLAPLFAATMIALSGAALAQDDDASTAPEASQGQEAQPKAFVLIQRNIYVPVDAEGKVASQNWIVIDKQGVITAEEMAKAAEEATSSESGDGDNDAAQAKPSAQKPAVGEGPMVRS